MYEPTALLYSLELSMRARAYNAVLDVVIGHNDRAFLYDGLTLNKVVRLDGSAARNDRVAIDVSIIEVRNIDAVRRVVAQYSPTNNVGDARQRFRVDYSIELAVCRLCVQIQRIHLEQMLGAKNEPARQFHRVVLTGTQTIHRSRDRFCGDQRSIAVKYNGDATRAVDRASHGFAKIDHLRTLDGAARHADSAPRPFGERLPHYPNIADLAERFIVNAQHNSVYIEINHTNIITLLIVAVNRY